MSRARNLERRDEILENASRLFAQLGFEGASIRVIARECGITEAAIYRYFESKEHLFESVVRAKARAQDIEGYLVGQRKLGDVQQVLTTVAHHIHQLSREDPLLLPLMVMSSLGTHRGNDVLFCELRLPYIRFLARELSERRDAGEVKNIDPYITARCFVGMVMACALNADQWRDFERLDLSAVTVIDNNIPIYADGLRAVPV